MRTVQSQLAHVTEALVRSNANASVVAVRLCLRTPQSVIKLDFVSLCFGIFLGFAFVPLSAKFSFLAVAQWQTLTWLVVYPHTVLSLSTVSRSYEVSSSLVDNSPDGLLAFSFTLGTVTEVRSRTALVRPSKPADMPAPISSSLHSDEEGVEVLPAPPSALIRLEPGRLVDDVDEEIFLLYTLNSKPQHDGGLGYVNHSNDLIYVSIDGQTWSSATSDRNLTGSLIVPVYQDVTSLRSSKGNTGSVLWRSTVELAIRFRQGTLFDLSKLKDAVVLELGAGTGALPAFVGGLSKRWLATDQEELLPLMRKNLDREHNVKVGTLDWFDFFNSPTPHTAQLRKKNVLAQLAAEGEDREAVGAAGLDLILCCDCIYNPGLFDALIATLNVFTEKDKTVVLVSCEMRSDESLAEFLTKWKQSDPAWKLVSLEERFDKGFVAIAAWKS